MKLTLLLQLAAVVTILCGCVCRYEDVSWHEVAREEIPATVMTAFNDRYPKVDVQRIERNVFKGRTINYKFYFRGDDQELSSAGVTLDGQVTEYAK